MMVPRAVTRRLAALALVAVTIAAAAGTMLAARGELEQRRRGRRREPPVSLNAPNTPYDGKFTFISGCSTAPRSAGAGAGGYRPGRTTIRAPSGTS